MSTLNEQYKRSKQRKHKRRKKRRPKPKKRQKRRGNNLKDPELQKNLHTKSSNKDLPIITEEDLEDGSFSDSYIPTTYNASNFFSYHTWGKDETFIRPPTEDRIVRSGPSIFHWPWDLSFGLYDDLNNSHTHTAKQQRSEIDTWLNAEIPIPSWQPLFAAVLWFIISMNILFPVAIIAQSTPCPHSYYHDDKSSSMVSANWHSIERTIHIHSHYPHLQVGAILCFFEIFAAFSSPISSHFILRFGPSWMLFVGILLMIISSIGMAFSWYFFNFEYVAFCILCRIISGIGFNIVRQSTLFLFSCFAKLDMLSSGLGFCVGPVFGDLLYTYSGIPSAFIVYAVILFCLLISIGIIIAFKLLSLEQISRMDIPMHIKNIKKPRYDLIEQQNSKQIGKKMYICFKMETLMLTIIGLTALG